MSNPEVNADFEDLVSALHQEGADFLIVGAFALAMHGVPRATGDLDLLVRPDPANAERVFRALGRFGAPLRQHGVSAADFAREGRVYQLGLPPRRIDLLTSISGVSFDEAAEGAPRGQLGSQTVRCIGRRALLKNKLAAGRAKDLADADALRALGDEPSIGTSTSPGTGND